MRPTFHPRLINDPFSDPGLFIPFLFERRALMFDLGELHTLSTRELLKVTHVFVTHTHMDHFIGFDSLLRVFLGRNKTIHLFGPKDFFGHVEGKLAGYTWNLVHEYDNNFELQVHEVSKNRVHSKAYVCRDRFRPKGATSVRRFNGPLLAEPAFSVEAVLLDHRIPCLGLALRENFYVNIMKEGLRELGLPVGPWLTRFKSDIYERKDPKTKFSVIWDEGESIRREKQFKLGELTEKIAKISPGQKIVYVTDVIGNSDNRRKIIDLAKGADLLFIEAAFLHEDLDTARKKYHLTAKEAGELAREAEVKDFQLFHFSPRYTDRDVEFETEARGAFEGE